MPTLSPVLKQAYSFRKSVAAGENKSTLEMVRAWSKVQQELSAQLDKALKQIAAETKAGKNPTVAQIYKSNQIKILLEQTNAELARYSEYTYGVVRDRQKVLIPEAIQHVETLTSTVIKTNGGAPKNAPISDVLSSVGWAYIDAAHMENVVGLLQPDMPIYQDMKAIAPNAVDKLKDAIITRVATGESAQSVSRDFKNELAGKLSNFVTLARTANMGAYRESKAQMFEENKDIVTGWQWMCLLTFTTCAACLSMNGTIHKNDEKMDSHMNCNCSQCPIIKGYKPEKMQSGDAWLKSQPEKIQRMTLSPAKYEAWKSGQISLQDLRGHTESDKYGGAYVEKSLKQALADK